MRAGGRAYRTGVAAEAVAERLYLREGGRVLARRWRAPEGEIDLVVAIGALIVFVEVKARRHGRAAAEALRPAQIRRLRAAIERFLAEEAPGAEDVRVDVVTVDRSGAAERIDNALSFEQ